jgi:hypothetical protein
MIYRVRIFLWTGERSSEYIGQHELRVRPSVGNPIQFKRDGALLTGRVKDIAPANWDPSSALIPAIYVTEPESASGARNR